MKYYIKKKRTLKEFKKSINKRFWLESDKEFAKFRKEIIKIRKKNKRNSKELKKIYKKIASIPEDKLIKNFTKLFKTEL